MAAGQGTDGAATNYSEINITVKPVVLVTVTVTHVRVYVLQCRLKKTIVISIIIWTVSLLLIIPEWFVIDEPSVLDTLESNKVSEPNHLSPLSMVQKVFWPENAYNDRKKREL